MGIEGTPIDLKKLQYFFAIENIDPRIGRVKVSQRRWDADSGKQKIDLEMEECKEFQEGGKFASQVTESQKTILNSVNLARKRDVTFLCPSNFGSLTVQGSFGADKFDYVKISYIGCNLGAECIPDEELNK